MGEDEDEVIVGAVVVAVVETGGNAPGQATAKAEVEAESTDPCGVARAMRVLLEAGAGQVEAPPEMKGTTPSIYRVNVFLFIFSCPAGWSTGSWLVHPRVPKWRTSV